LSEINAFIHSFIHSFMSEINAFIHSFIHLFISANGIDLYGVYYTDSFLSLCRL